MSKKLSFEEKVKIMYMQFNKSTEKFQENLDYMERMEKEQPGLCRPEKVKEISDWLNSEETQTHFAKFFEMMKGYDDDKLPDNYRVMRMHIVSEAIRMGWLEDQYDVRELERLIWLYVEYNYENRRFTKKQFEKIKKITSKLSEKRRDI